MEETKKEIAPISQEEFAKQIHESALANRAQVEKTLKMVFFIFMTIVL